MKISKNIDTIIQLISNVMESYTTALFLFDEDKDVLEMVSCQSISNSIKPGCVINSGEGVVGWVHREQKTLLTSNLEKRSASLKLYTADENIKSLLAVNLPGKMGVLYADSKKSYRFTEEKEKIFAQLGEVVMAFLIAGQELAEKKVVKNLLSLSFYLDQYFLEDLPFAELVEKCFSTIVTKLNLSAAYFVVPGRLIFSCTHDEQRKKCLSVTHPPASFVEEGLLGWCLKNKKMIVHDFLKQNNSSYVLNKGEGGKAFTNFLGIPLLTRTGTVLGVMGLIKPGNSRLTAEEKWNKMEIEILQRFVNRLARESFFTPALARP